MKALYHGIFKRSSTYAVAILASTFFFERAFDIASDSIFTSVNRGKLWDDIKHKYEQ